MLQRRWERTRFQQRAGGLSVEAKGAQGGGDRRDGVQEAGGRVLELEAAEGGGFGEEPLHLPVLLEAFLVQECESAELRSEEGESRFEVLDFGPVVEGDGDGAEGGKMLRIEKVGVDSLRVAHGEAEVGESLESEGRGWEVEPAFGQVQ